MHARQSPEPSFGSRLRAAWAGVVIVCAVFLAHFPALRGGFVWDDERHVTQPALRSVDGLTRIWTEIGATQQYYPLLHTVFWLEHRAWGNSTLGYHVANAALHALAAVLFGLLLRRLAVPGAWLAALIFALHPVHVESVAWISEQKNTLSLVFYLGAALVYLRFDEHRRARAYVAALALFLLGLLTKTTTATLPAALLVVAWWRRGTLSGRRDFLPLIPWLVLGAAAGLFTAWLERKLIGAEGAAFELSWIERGLLAGRVVWFYLGKLLWPENLTFIYPRWTIDPDTPATWMPLVALGIALGFAWRFRHRARAPLAVTLLFGGALFPVLGFFNVYPFQYSFVADHFQYLASLPVIACVGAVLASRQWNRLSAPALLLALGALTWSQSSTYRDLQTLYRTTIARNPDCWMAHNNLGKELMADRARLPEAIACFEHALALRPAYPEARNNLGLALTQSGRPHDAIPHIEESLRLKPNVFQAHNNLGIALASSGRAEDALRAFARAAALNPKLPNIHENWGKALVLLGRHTEADKHFAAAARLRQAPPP
jgi:protein O-mannosyl-transferase